RHRPAPAARSARRAGGEDRILAQLPGDGDLPRAVDARPRAADALLAHARRPDGAVGQLQARVADVGRRLAAAVLRAVLGRELPGRRFLGGAGFSRAFHGIGALLGLGLAGYTGVLLSVSNQPLWSDTWALGGLFLASGLSVSAASLGLLAAWRRVDGAAARKL